MEKQNNFLHSMQEGERFNVSYTLLPYTCGLNVLVLVSLEELFQISFFNHSSNRDLAKDFFPLVSSPCYKFYINAGACLVYMYCGNKNG